MTSLIRCSNGHYFDSSKHSSCPFCGVQNLDIDINKTMAKRSVPTGSANDEEGKTVGIYKKKLGVDPVVGWLVAIEGPELGKDFRIVAQRNFIGRSEKMDIRIAGDEMVSRDNHAIISFDPKKQVFRLSPGDSKGLVYLNEEEVVTPAVLKSNSIIEMGNSKLMFIPFCGDLFQWGDSDNNN